VGLGRKVWSRGCTRKTCAKPYHFATGPRVRNDKQLAQVDGHGRDGRCQPSNGSREAVARLPLPQNVACFPYGTRSFGFSNGVRSLIWWKASQSEAMACPGATTQHFAPLTLDDPLDSYEAPEISGDAVVSIVAAKEGVNFADLFTDRLMSYSLHELLQRRKATP
jgi:hypothetical protein